MPARYFHRMARFHHTVSESSEVQIASLLLCSGHVRARKRWGKTHGRNRQIEIVDQPAYPCVMRKRPAKTHQFEKVPRPESHPIVVRFLFELKSRLLASLRCLSATNHRRTNSSLGHSILERVDTLPRVVR